MFYQGVTLIETAMNKVKDKKLKDDINKHYGPLVDILARLETGGFYKIDENAGVAHKVKIFSFYEQKFQMWVAENMGEISSKGTLRLFKNKAGVVVFTYDNKKEILTIVQDGLTIDQLQTYGLGK